MPRALPPQQLHPHTPSCPGQAHALQGSLSSKAPWRTHRQRWRHSHSGNPGAVRLWRGTQNFPPAAQVGRLNPLDQGADSVSPSALAEENTQLWQLWTLAARTRRSRTRLESELPTQQGQRPAQCWRASRGGAVHGDSQRHKGR